MERSIGIRAAHSEDYEAVASLLRASGLPLEGLRENFRHAVVAARGDRIVGCVALEVYGGVALLRSLVVAEAARGEGLGERLATEALGLARGQGARDVYLLTETAAEFFPRFGFSREERSLAPLALQGSAECQSACPASAILMHARLWPR